MSPDTSNGRSLLAELLPSRWRHRPAPSRHLGLLLIWTGTLMGIACLLTIVAVVIFGDVPLPVSVGALYSALASPILLGLGFAVRAGKSFGRIGTAIIGIVVAVSVPIQGLWPDRKTVGIITNERDLVVGTRHVRSWTPNGGTVILVVGLLILILAVIAEVVERRTRVSYQGADTDRTQKHR